jgi:hypothetical protein
MSNQIPGKNCAAHSLERMSASLPPGAPKQTHGRPAPSVACCRSATGDLQIGTLVPVWPIRAPAKKQSSTAFFFHRPSMSTPFAALRGATVLRAATPARCTRPSSLADLIPAPASCLSLLHFSDLVEVARRSDPGNLQAIEGWPLRCRPSEKVWRQPHRHSQHRQWPQVEVVG